jgi:hypothetical protein
MFIANPGSRIVFSIPDPWIKKAPDLDPDLQHSVKRSNYADEDVLIMSSSPVEEAGGQKDGRTDVCPEEAARHSFGNYLFTFCKQRSGRKEKKIGDSGATKHVFFYS